MKSSGIQSINGIHIGIFSLAYLPLVGGAELAVRAITEHLSYRFSCLTLRFSQNHQVEERFGQVDIIRLGRGNPSRLGKIFYIFQAWVKAEKIHKQAFNVGYRNINIMELAQLVKRTLKDPKITFEVTPTDDKRSYHINSDKIKKALGFETKFTVEDAILSIKEAYEKGLIIDGLNNPIYHNVKQMKSINLR